MLAEKINKDKINKGFVTKGIAKFNSIFLNKFAEFYIINWG